MTALLAYLLILSLPVWLAVPGALGVVLGWVMEALT